MAKERLAYIDIAKGILILFLLMGHALLFIKNEGVNDSFINGFQNTRAYLWTPYYMPAFFVITGFCSNFNKPFTTTLWQNFKTLKIPAMIFGTFLAAVTMVSHHTLSASGITRHVALCWIDSGLWFLDALFISKILYWGIHRFGKRELIIFILCIVLFALGFILYRYINPGKDFGSVNHALMMTLFLFVGQWLKRRHEKVMTLKVTALIFIVYVAAAMLVPVLGKGMPYITNKIRLEEMSLMLFVPLSICGSLLIIYLSKVINHNRCLQYIGQHSLVYYMFNTFALNIAVKFLAPHMDSHLMCILLYIAVMLLTCAILTAINWVIDSKYLRFTLGKF
jgi:fucose 4-O-acetylase-like acetyltransferase